MQNVKNTIVDWLLGVGAPHLCFNCQKIGTLLCESCKYDIISEPHEACVLCGTLASANGLCARCRPPYSRAWCVGVREGALQRLIGAYKFNNCYDAYRPLADLLHQRLPDLPASVVVVPLPTVGSHIRQRGYDHTLLVAKQFAGQRGLACKAVLGRKGNDTQRGATKAKRLQQAKASFVVRQPVDTATTYLLIDDIVTTGASLHYAAQALVDAGAGSVWVAIIARQPLD